MDKKTRTDYFRIYGATRPAPRREDRMAKFNAETHRILGQAFLKVLDESDQHKPECRSFNFGLMLDMWFALDANDPGYEGARDTMFDHYFSRGASTSPSTNQSPDDDIPF